MCVVDGLNTKKYSLSTNNIWLPRPHPAKTIYDHFACGYPGYPELP